MNKHALTLDKTWKHYLGLAEKAGVEFFRHANCKWVIHDTTTKGGDTMTVRTFCDNHVYITAPNGAVSDAKYPGLNTFRKLVEEHPCPTGIKLWEDYCIKICELPKNLRNLRANLMEWSVKLEEVNSSLYALGKLSERFDNTEIDNELIQAGLLIKGIQSQRAAIERRKTALLKKREQIYVHASDSHVVEYQEQVLRYLRLTKANRELYERCAVSKVLNISRCWWWPGHTLNIPRYNEETINLKIDRFPQRMAA